jgi:hypothetical protein
MVMSDTSNGITISPYGFIVSGNGAYGAGLGALTAYPQATGYYWSYLGADGTRSISTTVESAITNSGLVLNPIDKTVSPFPSTDLRYSNNPIARLGNPAIVDAANSISAQYGRFVSNLKMELNAVSRWPQNIYTYANGQTFRPDLTYRTFSPRSGGTAHFDEVKAVSNLTGSSNNLKQVAQ